MKFYKSETKILFSRVYIYKCIYIYIYARKRYSSWQGYYTFLMAWWGSIIRKVCLISDHHHPLQSKQLLELSGGFKPFSPWLVEHMYVHVVAMLLNSGRCCCSSPVWVNHNHCQNYTAQCNHGNHRMWKCVEFFYPRQTRVSTSSLSSSPRHHLPGPRI